MSSSSSSSDDSNEESGIDNHPAPVDVALSSSSSYDDSSSEESDSNDHPVAVVLSSSSLSDDSSSEESDSDDDSPNYNEEDPGKETPDSDDPQWTLPPWTKSCSRKCIIDDLKNDQSSIHALASVWEANIDELWKQYAPQYQRGKFKGYMTTIMHNYNAKKGPFKVKSGDPTSLWEESSSRKRIIKDLKDYKSSIHKLVQDLEKKKNLDKIWTEYAPQYQRGKFKGYMDTIMKNYRAKKGPFKDTWYSKTDGINSKGYSLLYQLMVNNDIGDVSSNSVFALSFIIYYQYANTNQHKLIF